VAEILGRPVTFLGQWEKLQIIIVCVRDSNGCPENTHKLPMPFTDDDVKGDLLLMKVDENAVPRDFTTKEYNEFKNKEPEEWQMKKPEEANADQEEEEEEEEDEDDEHEEEHDGEDDEDDEEHMGAFIEMMLSKVVERFESDNGRKPSEGELAVLKASLEAKFGEQVEVDDSEEEEDEDGEEGAEEDGEGEGAEDSRGAVLEQIVSAFKAQHGREPDMEEIKEVLRNIQQEQQEATEGGPSKKQKTGE
jgi:hypothetical protein